MVKTKLILQALNRAIDDVLENFRDYCSNPEKNFSRNRKLSFKDMLRIPLAMQCKSLQPELSGYFNYRKDDTPTKSAFVQKRQQIAPEAFQEVFRRFNAALPFPQKKMNGYQLIACDGTDVNLPRNPKDTATSVHAKPGAKSYNIMHINAFYDLLNGVYTDYSFDFGFVAKEVAALKNMAGHIPNPQKTILIADRCYGTYGTMLALREKGIHFCSEPRTLSAMAF